MKDVGIRHCNKIEFEHFGLPCQVGNPCKLVLSDDGLVHLASLHQLWLLDCRDLTDAGMVHLSGLHQLEHLVLSCRSELTGAGLVPLAGLHQLRHLDLSHAAKASASLVRPHPVTLPSHYQLERLDLGHSEHFTQFGCAT
eukprot:g6194.t1